MDNQKKLATFGTQDTSEKNKKQKQKTKTKHTHNTIGVGHYYTQT